MAKKTQVASILQRAASSCRGQCPQPQRIILPTIQVDPFLVKSPDKG